MSVRCFDMLPVLVVPGLLLCFSYSASAEGPSIVKDAQGRTIMRDERPDEARGWTVVSKASFWPLCYESLDRLQETQKMIGQADANEIADALDKCAAWLELAASATSGSSRSGMQFPSVRFNDAADSLRSGSKDWTDSKLNDLITLGLLAMSKSHVVRAAAYDEDYQAERASPNKTAVQTKEIKAAAVEIANAKVESLVAQYRYDAIQSKRHLDTAQVYLEAASKQGSFDVDKTMSAEIPDLTETERSDVLIEYVDVEIRPRIKQMRAFIDEKRAPILKSLDQ